MLREIVATLKDAVVGWVRSIGDVVKRLVDPMRALATASAGAARDAVRSRSELVAENAFLRQQLIVLRRQVNRPIFHNRDRLLMVLLASLKRAWRDALHLVQPETLLRWHRELFRLFWRRRSRSGGSQPRRLRRDTIELIVSMAEANVLWGAERIRGELLKLGIRVSKRTIQKHMKCARPPALLHGSGRGRIGPLSGFTGFQFRTASDSGIPSSVMRLRMFTPIIASLVCPSGDRDRKRPPTICLNRYMPFSARAC